MRGLADGKSIAYADAIATTENSNNFLRETLDKSVEKHRMQEEYAGVNAALDANTRLVRVRYGYIEGISEKAFRGLATPADLEYLKIGNMNFIEASIIESLTQLENEHDQIAKVVMPFYIDETSQLVRGYMIDGEPA
ncbi:MAG: hypothetical protein KBB94_00060 [Legionellaceae bacterium]|nr:hypothetical protein [Legionellaceae bacterium]MBP9774450.1 hypothetical protein [Legionellaceae bacterium]